MSDISDDFQKETESRLGDARRQKSQIEQDLREGYFFTAPQRSRDVSSYTSTAGQRNQDAAELNTSLGFEVAQDHATEMLNTFMPPSLQWCQQKPGIDLPEDAFEGIKDDIEKQTSAIHAGIKASNFYAAAAQAFMPDLAIGTTAVWIDDLRTHEPIVSQAVPIRELEINIGPYGLVDDRFVVRPTRFRHLPALLPGVELPADVQKKVKEKGNTTCRVIWGFWRLWDKPDVVWQAIVRIDNRVIWKAELEGEGACPLIVGRMNADSISAWGNGSTIMSLPDLRHLDEVRALHIDSADFQIHKPFIYGDDGIMNFSAGIEPGKGYPARPWANGSPIHLLEFGGDVNFTHFELNQIEQGIRRMHYVDFPEQIGKTPPTAEQWLDQLQRTKKRIGTPGTIFFREFPVGVFQRFKYLLEKRGTIKAINANGKQIALTAYDPTEVAQKQQDAMIAVRVLEIATQNFPQISQVAIDPLKTLQAIKDAFGDKLVAIRSEAEIKGAMQQFGALAAKSDPSGAGGGMAPVADPGAQAPPGGAPPVGPGAPGPMAPTTPPVRGAATNRQIQT